MSYDNTKQQTHFKAHIFGHMQECLVKSIHQNFQNRSWHVHSLVVFPNFYNMSILL